MSILASLGSIVIFFFTIYLIYKSYKKMRSKENEISVNTKPTLVYRKWYAVCVPMCGISGAVLFNLLTFSDAERDGFEGISVLGSSCLFSAIGFYMTCVAVTGVFFVLRRMVYNKEKMLLLFVFSIPIGIVLFPVYYVYSLIIFLLESKNQKSKSIKYDN